MKNFRTGLLYMAIFVFTIFVTIQTLRLVSYGLISDFTLTSPDNEVYFIRIVNVNTHRPFISSAKYSGNGIDFTEKQDTVITFNAVPFWFWKDHIYDKYSKRLSKVCFRDYVFASIKAQKLKSIQDKRNKKAQRHYLLSLKDCKG